MSLRILSLLIVIVTCVCAGALAQSEREFIDKAESFRITLVGGWQPVTHTDAFGRQKTEFVYQNRATGLLRIAKERLAGRSLAEKIDGDLDELTSHYACLYTRRDAISGLLSGVRVSLYYFEDSRWIVGTYYFLQDGDRAWTLFFTGRQGSPGIALETTDKMVRTFAPFVALPKHPAKATGGLSDLRLITSSRGCGLVPY